MYEVARSYLFLEALREGATNCEASDRASLNEKDVTQVIEHLAKFHRRNAYKEPVLGSKIWPQIGEAYRRGMHPMLPDVLWQTIYNWSRESKYPFPPVVRAQLLLRKETAYEAYYTKVLSILAEQTGIDVKHVLTLVGKVDDEKTRDAFNGQVAPEEWATTLRNSHLRNGETLAKDMR